MKSKLTVLLLLVSFTISAQEFYFKHTIDWKMAMEGPGHTYEVDSSWNPEFVFGLELERNRIAIGYESHKAIEYSKMFIQYDKKIKLGRFSFFGGLEAGYIKRVYDVPLTNFNGLIVNETQRSMTIGANFETQLKITEGISLTANINTFTTEGGRSTKTEFLRWDVMAGIVFKIPVIGE